jgi:hypothetical protein
LVACSGKEETVIEKPENLLGKDTLIPIIVDLQVLESHYHRKYQQPDYYKDALDSASEFIFSNYSTSREIFEMSFDHYSVNMDSMYYIYEAALDTINLRVSNSQQDKLAN